MSSIQTNICSQSSPCIDTERPLCDVEQAALTSRWPHRPDVVYLDHGAFGGCPVEVTTSQNKIRSTIESNPHDFFERKFPFALHESKQALARFLNCDVRGLVLLPGATHALNVVINGQKFRPGDEILTTSHAYSSVKMALDLVAQRDGAKVVVADVPFPTESHEQIIQCILSRVTPRTRFAVVDHISSRTAMIFPVKQIVSLLAARGIDTLVDGAHVPGMIELDITSINAPYYAANCHKWMCSPRGVGFLHVRHDRIDRIQPLIIARSPHMVNRSEYSALQHSFDWLGTCDPSAHLSLPATIKFLETVVQGGYSGLVQRNHRIAAEAREVICSKLGIPVPCPEYMIGAMATVPLPDTIGPASEGMLPLQNLLWEKYRIVVPVYAWPSHPKRILRISVQAFNFLDQYAWMAEKLLMSLPECTALECVPRSLPPSSGRCKVNWIDNTDNPKSFGHSKDDAVGAPPNGIALPLPPHPDFQTALISLQPCVDPYFCTGTLKKCSPDPAASELSNPNFHDLQNLSLLRIASVLGRNQTTPPPLLYPMTKRDHSQLCHTETEISWLTYTLSNYPERGLPAAHASLIQGLLNQTSILDEWQGVVDDLQRSCDTVVEQLLLQMDVHPVMSSEAGETAFLDKKLFACKIVPYAMHDAPSNFALRLWNRALEEAAQRVEAGRFECVESFLQIHAFLKDPIGGLTGSFERQLDIFKTLLQMFTSETFEKLSCEEWKAVIAQLAMESSFLAIPMLQEVAHVYVTEKQQLTYLYVALNELRRVEFSSPRLVLELVREMVENCPDDGSCNIEIAPITIAYCPSLQRTGKPSTVIIDGNNRATAVATLRFLATHGLEILESTGLTRELERHCEENKLGEKWFVDVYDVLLELRRARQNQLDLLRARWRMVGWLKNVKRVPVLLAQEQSFHTVWCGGDAKCQRITLLQPIQQSIFADEMLRHSIPSKRQSHGRSLGFKALPLKC